MNGVLRVLAELLYPAGANCMLCLDPRHADSDGLCPECRKRLDGCKLSGRLCARCGHPLDENGGCPLCLKGDCPAVDQAIAAYTYEAEARQLIHLLKYGYNNAAAELLTPAMAEAYGAHAAQKCDIAVFVPCSKRRRSYRGANQAEELCKRVAARLGLPVADALMRANTQSQVRMSREKRLTNVKGAFLARDDMREIIEGKRVLLVDDVMTTGATAQECAETLKRMGAKGITLLTSAFALKRT